MISFWFVGWLLCLLAANRSGFNSVGLHAGLPGCFWRYPYACMNYEWNIENLSKTNVPTYFGHCISASLWSARDTSRLRKAIGTCNSRFASSARFAHSRFKQVSRSSKCPIENLYGKPHQKKKLRRFSLLKNHETVAI
jgi:hypothetical protein